LDAVVECDVSRVFPVVDFDLEAGNVANEALADLVPCGF